MIRLAVAALIGAALSVPASGPPSLYVAPAGSDTAAGTARSPFATLQHALDVAPSGTTIRLAPGRYLQDAVTVRPGATIAGPPTAVLSGGGGARILQIRHDDIRLTGFTIDGLVGDPALPTSYRDKLLYAMSTTPGDGVDRLTVDHMTFTHAAGECVRLRYLVTAAQIHHNAISHCGVDDFVFGGGGKNGEGIYLGTAPEQQGANGAPDAAPDVSRDNHIYANVIDTRGNECVDIKEHSTANLVESNVCTGQRDDKSGGFDSRGNGNIFRYNIVTGNVGAGVRLGGDTAAYGIGNSVYGNVITGNQAGGIKFQGMPQERVCGNLMADNVGGDAVGTYAGQFQPTAPCV